MTTGLRYIASACLAAITLMALQPYPAQAQGNRVSQAMRGIERLQTMQGQVQARKLNGDEKICSIEWNRHYGACTYNILNGDTWATVSQKTVAKPHACLDAFFKQAKQNGCTLYLKECAEETENKRCVQDMATSSYGY